MAKKYISKNKSLSAAFSGAENEDRESLEEKIGEHTKNLESAYKDLRVADKLKDEFLATLSHELRNPLNPLIIRIELLREYYSGSTKLRRVTDPIFMESFEVMERQVKTMARLLDDLLDASKIITGNIRIKKERVDLVRLIKNCIEAVEPTSRSKNNFLSFNVPYESLEINGDGVRIEQIFTNLLDNAIKYTPAGGQISLSVEAKNGFVTVKIKDNGIGIAQENLKSIFQIFSQVDKSIDRSYSGLGIGLKLVKTFVELHGGKVKAKSPGLGLGSEFTVTLPKSSNGKIKSKHQVQEERTVRSFKVLIVDDIEDAAISLGKLLERLGHQVRIAFNGPEALETVPVFKPEFIILDLAMPIMDGYEVVRKIRSRKENKDIRIIALTGFGQATDKQTTRDSGFDMHMTKPIDIKELKKIFQAESNN
jgi:signal transduction histidine kinase/CheY-like chemotaxis protein